jgi:hypothetical protein
MLRETEDRNKYNTQKSQDREMKVVTETEAKTTRSKDSLITPNKNLLLVEYPAS